MYLKHASMLLNPKPDSNGHTNPKYTYEEVVDCLTAMNDGLFTTAFGIVSARTMLFVLYGDPPYIERMKDIEKYLPPKPPIYEKKAYQDWQDKYSKYLKEK